MTSSIVVGVDGSDHSRRAVEWCAKYAPALDAEVVAVYVIDVPVYVGPEAGLSLPPSQAPLEEIREVVRQDWCKPLAEADVPYRVELGAGSPAFGIIEAARTEDAEFVVAGRRGRGGFTELVLGSTTHQLTHHLDRPLVVVP